MYIVDNTTDNNHYSVIDSMFPTADELVIISPFCFPDFGHFFGKVANHGSIKKITFMTTLSGEEIASKTDSLLSFVQMAVKYGIEREILINDSLHGKVYLFKRQGKSIHALITSANITHRGLSKNHEWGCCFDDEVVIEKLEKTILSTVGYRLTDDMLEKVRQRVDLHKKEQPATKQSPSPVINISDIIISHRFNVDIDPKTRIFLKPIGHTENPVFDGDYSHETEQYFAVHPVAVRKNDLLISYGVGSRKIISIFKVLSDVPLNTGKEDSRWPWYVEVDNITPKYGKIWFEKNLYITDLARDYVDTYDLNITNNGGKTLGALQWGVDKIRLSQDFGTELLSLVMSVEKKL